MLSIKQQLIVEIMKEIAAKEQEIQGLSHELYILNAKLKVEKMVLSMQDIQEHLKEDFKYSAQALEDIVIQEQHRNSVLNKELEILKYRKEVIESQFSDNELDY